MDTGIYTRISEDDGTALGVARQLADCQAEADRRGWKVVDVFEDNDVSATRAKVRPAYQRMVQAIESGRIGGIVVWDVDRLTRQPRELEDIIDLADRYGLKLANVGGEIDLSTPQGRMMARIKGTVARHDVEQQSRRIKRKVLEKAEAGQPHGRAPFGYRRENGADVVVPEQAEVIREAARRILAGESLRGVAADLNDREVSSPSGRPWVPAMLRQVIRRPGIAGLRRYTDADGKTQTVRSAAEAIITEETLSRLEVLFSDPQRRANYAGRQPKYLLSGIARCGRCGLESAATMRRAIGHTNTLADGRTKRQPPSYVCATCHKVRRVQEPVDAYVRALIVARLARPDLGAGLFTSGNPEAAASARESIAGIDAKLATLADDYTEDAITRDQFKRSTASLRAERTRLEGVLRSSAPSSTLADFTHGDVAAKWDSAPIEVQRAVVETLLESVVILPSGIGKRFAPELVLITWRSVSGN